MDVRPRIAVSFRDDRVLIGNESDAVRRIWPSRPTPARVPLSATGFYPTPKMHWDRETAHGRPFFYFAYGAAVSAKW